VLAVVKSVVPKAFSEVKKDDPVPWSQNGEDYEKARAGLLDLLGK
jgi:hypothetical protein